MEKTDSIYAPTNDLTIFEATDFRNSLKHIHQVARNLE